MPLTALPDSVFRRPMAAPMVCWRGAHATAHPTRAARLAGRAATALVAWASLAASGLAHAQLVVVDHEVVLQLRGPGLPNVTPRAPWTLSDSATTAAGSSAATADLPSAHFKVASDWTGAVVSATAQQARALARIEFRNDHGFGIVFAAGAIHADLSGSFGWSPGAGTAGISNQLYGRLVVRAPGIAGGTSNTVLSYDQNQESFDVTQAATPGSASVVVHGVSAGAISATLNTAAFTLAPGEVLQLSFEFEAQSWGTNGWSAFVDASNSAQLSMQLPAGVTLVSPQVLSWVSVVPEPGAGWLMAVGLAGLLGWRQRRASVTPSANQHRTWGAQADGGSRIHPRVLARATASARLAAPRRP